MKRKDYKIAINHFNKSVESECLNNNNKLLARKHIDDCYMNLGIKSIPRFIFTYLNTFFDYSVNKESLSFKFKQLIKDPTTNLLILFILILILLCCILTILFFILYLFYLL
jgi:hypothetical protein